MLFRCSKDTELTILKHPMFKLILLSLWALYGSSVHEFHTSLMDLTYDKETKSFLMEIEVDTEHFEQVLNEVYEMDVHLGEDNEVEDLNDLIEAYFNEQLFLQINGKIIGLTVSELEVDYAHTHITFEAIKQRRRVKKIYLENTYMLEAFSEQQNLVNIYYKKKKRALLFDTSHTSEEVKF